MLNLSRACRHWTYQAWQRNTAGFLRCFSRNTLPNNDLIGYVINDKHPKSIRVQCDRYNYYVRFKKVFRMAKKVWCHDEKSEARLGDVVRIQPMGYRIGPWKSYVLVRILHKEPRDPIDTSRKVEDDGRSAASLP
eukprot:GDKH01025014.1.p2 GENE.GDKH01025014.1~~GDKH01025014.1.p2  ORF type:complete len:135 (+),score=14.74 GDKH01025014.1:260-664(+)